MVGAAKAVADRGKVVRPVLDEDRLFRFASAVAEGADLPNEAGPHIGSLPNAFVVQITGGDHNNVAREVACSARCAFDKAWDRICDAVYQKFLPIEVIRAGFGTESIWRRQVQGFWEFNWVVGSEDSGALLASRKFWRSHRAPNEPGDKCTVMHDFQELSGHIAAVGPDRRKRQVSFWRRLRARLGPLDLRDDERLCAVALIKRLFPLERVVKSSVGWRLDRARWPSTVHVAAAPWLKRVVNENTEAASSYVELLSRHLPQAGVILPEAPSIPELSGLSHPLILTAADYLHINFLEDSRRCPLQEDLTSVEEDDADFLHKVAMENTSISGARKEIIESLKGLYSATTRDNTPLGRPKTFYSLLLADGDRLGQLVKSLGDVTVSRALSLFTRRVGEVITQHNGVTIYAGGDDLMALLPMDRAIECAAAIASAYEEAFNDATQCAEGSRSATLSAAVVFAHIRIPLGAVVRTAHRLLDDVAKNENGRNSIAAAVYKSGGIRVMWATTWVRENPNASRVESVAVLLSVVAELQKISPSGGLSTSLIYRLREVLSLLCGWPRWEPGTWKSLPKGTNLSAFLSAEISRCFVEAQHDSTFPNDQGKLVEQLETILLRATNRKFSARSQESKESPEHEVGIDGLLLARFLVDGGHEEDGR